MFSNLLADIRHSLRGLALRALSMLGIVVVVAGYLLARRASRVDPVIALRSD